MTEFVDVDHIKGELSDSEFEEKVERMRNELIAITSRTEVRL